MNGFLPEKVRRPCGHKVSAAGCLYKRNRAKIPEEQQRIFDKFYRRDEARQTNSGGAGLGLAIAKELVDLHGGTIRVMSENGRTTFKVCLPRRKMPMNQQTLT